MKKINLKNKQSLGSIKGPNNTLIECILITPEIADQLLDLNTNNRAVKEQTKNKYARDMSSGEWVFNGEPIQILENGELTNGQHRLFSCIESGKSFWCIVIWGLPEIVRMTIDVGPVKSTADHLRMLGVKNSSIVAPAAKKCMSELLPNGNARKIAFSNTEVYNEVNGNKKEVYQKAAIFAAKMYLEYPNINKPTYAFSYVELINKGHDLEKIKDFFEQLTDQKDACETVKNLRKRISPPTNGTKIPTKMKEYFLKQAWNEWVNGNEEARILNCRKYREGEYVRFE